MKARELIEILEKVDTDMEIVIEGRDPTGEYCDAYEMTEKHIYIGDERIVIVAD